MKKKKVGTKSAKKPKNSRRRALEGRIKTQLIDAIAASAKNKGLTHVALAERSGLSRSAVTGILSGSMQKVTINRLLRLVEAAGLMVELKVKDAR